MIARPAWAAVVGLCILLVTPLAYATPSDPAWIPGVWDDGDHDDVVHLVTGATGLASVDTEDGAPSAIVVRALPDPDSETRPDDARSIAPSRAPPAA